jgi:hypothetical protein
MSRPEPVICRSPVPPLHSDLESPLVAMLRQLVREPNGPAVIDTETGEQLRVAGSSCSLTGRSLAYTLV